MEWIQFVIYFTSFLVLFFWNRSEYRSDARRSDARIDALRELIYSVHNETTAQINAIRDEMKDFHVRLCVIEERRIKG